MAEPDEKNLELLSVEEAAAYLKFSTAFLYKLCKENKIPHVNYGRHIIFRKTDLYNWLGSMVTYSEEKLEA
ncbi:MAG: helix-turn-helix domain-containing protein [Treponema sp.]|nr:helix-turn-helix domain-containing protein [Treponema sp.]